MARNRRTTPPVLAGTHEAAIAGQKIAYTVKRSARARRARLEITPGVGLTIIIPRHFPVKAVPEMVNSRSRWIAAALARKSVANPLPLDKPLKSGDVIPYLGRNLKLVVRPAPDGGCRMTLDRDELLIDLPLSQEDLLSRLLGRWYRFNAVRYLEARVNAISGRLGMKCQRIGIRGQKTRWGSCSRDGGLSLNWKLMMAPEEVIDYVVIHELTHLQEMNHSRRFWQRVAEKCPRFQEHKQWLREHEGLLAALCA